MNYKKDFLPNREKILLTIGLGIIIFLFLPLPIRCADFSQFSPEYQSDSLPDLTFSYQWKTFASSAFNFGNCVPTKITLFCFIALVILGYILTCFLTNKKKR